MKIKNLILIVFVMALASCSGNKKENASAVNSTEGGKVEFTALVENPGEFLGKEISVEGKVVHVCTHSGKKLFITGENPDIMLYIQAGEEMPKFPMDLMGSNVVVQGTMAMAGSAPAGETMTGEGNHMMAANADTCATSQAMAVQTALADMVMVYSKHSVVK